MTLDRYFYIRIMSFITLLALAGVLGSHYTPVFLGMIFSHYLLSFLYAKKQVKTALTSVNVWLAAIPLTLLGFLSLKYALPPVPIYIAIHIALSDVYTANSAYPARLSDKMILILNSLRLLLQLGLFGVVLRHVPPFNLTNPSYFACLAFAMFVALGFVLIAWRANISLRQSSSLMLFEASGLLLASVIWYFNWQTTLQELVFYHVLTWIFLPSLDMRKNRAALSRFALWNVVLFGIFYAFNLALGVHGMSLSQVLPLFAIIHVMTSVPLSRLNPYFLRKLFFPPPQLELRVTNKK